MRKRLIKEVNLVFFEDDATGDWGITHNNTYDESDGRSFNAIWTGPMIFHDVFEHSHEFSHKYFKGDYALNIGGEMTAMGAMWYYYNRLNIHNRDINPTSMYSMAEKMKHTTLDDVKEAIGGYPRYGYTLESCVPRQKPVEDGELEYQIEDFWKEVKEYNSHYSKSDGEQEREDGRNYRKSVTFGKIANLHRYGYRMAERLVPDNYENQRTLYTFICYWNDLCKNYQPEVLAHVFRQIVFKVYRSKDNISWEAIFKTSDPFDVKNVIVNEDRKFELEYYGT